MTADVYGTDNGPSCQGCGGTCRGTVYCYRVPELCSYAVARCVACGAEQMFTIPTTGPIPTASELRALHAGRVKSVHPGRAQQPGTSTKPESSTTHNDTEQLTQ